MQKPKSDVSELRNKARLHVECGPLTESYHSDPESVINLLNEALATELVCVLRYRRHYFMARGVHSRAIAEEFMEHSQEEQMHADKLALRITQLGGEPDLNPATLTSRSLAEYVEGKDLQDMIKENLIAERIAVDSYRSIIQFLGNSDPTTRRLIEEILETEEEHADDLVQLLDNKSDDETAYEKYKRNGGTSD